MICAICGKPITDKVSKDHFIPRAVYKWHEHILYPKERKRVHDLIYGNDNMITTHVKCNSSKEEMLLSPYELYVGEEEMDRLEHLYHALYDVLDSYTRQKFYISLIQKNKCLCCGRSIKYHGVLRRIDPSLDRSWSNACIVCHRCNYRHADFISYYEKG